jgi:hypothetical protein
MHVGLLVSACSEAMVRQVAGSARRVVVPMRLGTAVVIYRCQASRRTMIKPLAIVGLITLAFLAEVRAEPNKVLYELQERCGKQATDWFVSEWGRRGIVNTSDGQIMADFQNHYNSKLNTCIVLLNTTSITTKKPKSTFSSSTLFDLLEIKTIGECWDTGNPRVFNCHVLTGTYTSFENWRDAVKSYLEQ